MMTTSRSLLWDTPPLLIYVGADTSWPAGIPTDCGLQIRARPRPPRYRSSPRAPQSQSTLIARYHAALLGAYWAGSDEGACAEPSVIVGLAVLALRRPAPVNR